MDKLNNLFLKLATRAEANSGGGGEDFGTKVSTLSAQIWSIAGIVIPVLAGLAGVFVIFKLITLGIKLAQTSDDPEERSQTIKGMIWWGIGLIVCIAAAVIAPSVIFKIFGTITEIKFGK